MEIREENAVVSSVVPADGAAEVTVRFDADARVERALVRIDLVPQGLKAGDRVALTKAALYRRWQIRLLE